MSINGISQNTQINVYDSLAKKRSASAIKRSHLELNKYISKRFHIHV